MKDYYYILGIKQDANTEEIKSAYRKMSHIFHPDKNKNDSFYEKQFIEITEAYQVLIDSESRKDYDRKRNTYYLNFQIATIQKDNVTSSPNKQPKKNVLTSSHLLFFLLIIIILGLLIFGLKQKQYKSQVTLINDSLNTEIKNRDQINQDTIKTFLEQVKDLNTENLQLREKIFSLSFKKPAQSQPKLEVPYVEIINPKGFGIELRNLQWQKSYRSNEIGERNILIQLSILNRSEKCFRNVICDFEVLDETGIPVNSGFFFLDNFGGNGYLCKGSATEISVSQNIAVYYRKGQRIKIIIDNIVSVGE